MQARRRAAWRVGDRMPGERLNINSIRKYQFLPLTRTVASFNGLHALDEVGSA